MLTQCYYKLEDYDALEGLISVIDERHPLLNIIAKMFVSVGRCSSAVAAYLKMGDLRSTVNLCIRQNQWDEAIALAKQGNLSQVPDLLAQYASYLTSRNSLGKAVQLYYKANRYLDAVQIVHQVSCYF